MQCEFNGCKEEFIDTPKGLAEMTFHVLISHSAKEINGKENEEVCRSRTAEEQILH